MTPAIFSPLRIAGLELANRIVVSPMCQYSANDGCASDWHMTHLGTLANSGAGLLVFEMTDVERRGRISHGCLGLYSDACEAALARIVHHCRQIGTAKLGIQLAHSGRKGSCKRNWEGGGSLGAGTNSWETIGPSAIPFAPGWQVPRAMVEEDFDRIRTAFAEAAKRAVRVGFDAVELHLAHGYLLHNFLSPLSNRRTDNYGGSLENRMRFPLEIARVVREATPRHIALGARMTGSDWHSDGISLDEAVAQARMLQQTGLDYLDISAGGATGDIRNPTTPGYNAPLAARIRRETGIITRTVGLIQTPELADTIVDSGQADFIAIGRAMLDDPHWGWHAAKILGGETARPRQYVRVTPTQWTGPALRVA